MSATAFHLRNRHQGSYNLAQLSRTTPELTALLITSPRGVVTIDFANPVAVKTLNAALLNAYYGIKHWDIPDGYLCPPVPGRADYIHYLADLLAQEHGGVVPSGADVRVLDIGTGANLIYPLVGHGEYGWHFVGSDIDPVALAAAQTLIQSNPGLDKAIELRLQRQARQYFKGLLLPGERYQLTMCNPPFHESFEQAQAGSLRKWRGLAKVRTDKTSKVRPGKIKPRSNTLAPVLNFGGQHNELWCPGGEAAFVTGMIKESKQFSHQVDWFSSLVSKEASLPLIYRALRAVGAQDVHTVDMTQGHKKSRFVAWAF